MKTGLYFLVTFIHVEMREDSGSPALVRFVAWSFKPCPPAAWALGCFVGRAVSWSPPPLAAEVEHPRSPPGKCLGHELWSPVTFCCRCCCRAVAQKGRLDASKASSRHSKAREGPSVAAQSPVPLKAGGISSFRGGNRFSSSSKLHPAVAAQPSTCWPCVGLGFL